MPMITDWLMVAITGIYVAATIFICVFNARSASATREQVAESKRQFEESKRLETLPFLQVETTTINEYPLFKIDLCFFDKKTEYINFKTVKLKNLGNGAASNIIYTWERNDTLNHASGYPPINAIMQGDSYIFCFRYIYDTAITGAIGVLTWQYDDLLGNSYEQKVFLIFDEGDLVRCENNTPEYLGNVEYELAAKKECAQK